MDIIHIGGRQKAIREALPQVTVHTATTLDEAATLAGGKPVLLLIDHGHPVLQQAPRDVPHMVLASEENPVELLAAKAAGAEGFIVVGDRAAFRAALLGALDYAASQ